MFQKVYKFLNILLVMVYEFRATMEDEDKKSVRLIKHSLHCKDNAELLRKLLKREREIALSGFSEICS